MAGYSDFSGVKAAVDSKGGLLSMPMRHLRDAHGVDRLGVHVRRAIHDKLLGHGIGHTPEDLPEYQERMVRLYTLGSPFDKTLRDMQDLSEDADQRLRETFGNDYEDVVQKIKELVF